jgi:hypothetical protein
MRLCSRNNEKLVITVLGHCFVTGLCDRINYCYYYRDVRTHPAGCPVPSADGSHRLGNAGSILLTQITGRSVHPKREVGTAVLMNFSSS